MNNAKAYTGTVDIHSSSIRVILGYRKMPHRQWSDDVLLTQVVRGDVAAFEILYDRHAALVLGIALKITDDQALAEEALKETFWRVWQDAATYQSAQGSLASWIFRMARKLAMEAKIAQRLRAQRIPAEQEVE